jgi:Flp pilus assembly protein TadD
VRLADAFDRDQAPRSKEPLVRVVDDADEAPSLRGAALVLLAQRFAVDARREAEPLLAHESPLLRMKAASALGMSSAHGSRDALAKALGDRSLPVVQSAAVALTSLGDLRGVEALEKLAADPRGSHLVTVQFSLAIQKMRSKDPAGAIPILEKVLTLAPYHVEANVMLADALVRTGRRTEARARLEEALRFDPQHKGALQRLQSLE